MIKRLHHAQSETTLRMLNRLQAQGACSFANLLKWFAPGNPQDADVQHAFLAKMQYLTATKQVLRQGSGRAASYTIGPKAGQLIGTYKKKATSAIECGPSRPLNSAIECWPKRSLNPNQPAHPAPVEGQAPNRPDHHHHGDIRHLPVYAPGCGPSLRRGSQDHRQHASFGVRC